MGKYDEHVARVLATAPHPTTEQLDIIHAALRGEKPTVTPKHRQPSPEELAETERDSLNKKMHKALNSCHGCSLPEVAHRVQKGHGMGFHDFVPLGADDMLKIVRRYKKQIDAVTPEEMARRRDNPKPRTRKPKEKV